MKSIGAASTLSAKYGGLLHRILLAFLLGLVFTAFYYSFQVNKTAVVEKLSAVAILAENDIRSSLRRDAPEEVAARLETIASGYSIDGIELYNIDGMVIAAHGIEAGGTPSSLMLGEHLSVGSPFLLMVQYSRIILHDDRPLGLLILYADLSLILIAGLLVTSLAIAWIFLPHHRIFPTRRRSRQSPGGRKTADAAERSGQQLEKRLLERIAELEKQRDQAVLSASAKGDFLASTSHEIRTSMNGVVGVLSLLEKSGFTGEKKRLLNAAARSADSLLLVINDILDFSKIEAGRMEFEKIEFELREIVEECIALYIDTAGSKKIRLHCYLPLDISTRVLGDPTRLRQVITNLLSNAVKFTEEGEVSFRVSLLSEKDGVQQLRFTVEDTGIGVEPDKLGHLFDMFTQAGADTARKYGGTGLGLNVCKKLVEMQGGEIGVNSLPGQGSTFWFVLGFKKVGNGQNVPLFEEIREKNIILFDDCETCTTVMNQYLRHSRLRSRSAGSSKAILEQLRVFSAENCVPDILLVDYQMIAADTDRFITGILTHYGEEAPELYILSRQGGIEDMLKRKGVSGIIYKPVRLLQLHEELCGEAGVQETASREQPELISGRVLLVDDEHINRHVGEMILKKLGLDVDVAVSGREALRRVQENHHDLILMDVQMPGMDGIRTTELIREKEIERGEPAKKIVAMTANALPSVKERCLAAGMDGYLTKPIKPEMLVQYLKPYFATRGKKADIGEIEAIEDTLPSSRVHGKTADDTRRGEFDFPVWDRSLALEYVGGDEDLLVQLMGLFIERKEALLSAIEESMRIEDTEEISCAAHAFKGAVNHFAARKCQQLAYAIEDRAGQGSLDGLAADLEKLRREADLLVEHFERQRN